MRYLRKTLVPSRYPSVGVLGSPWAALTALVVLTVLAGQMLWPRAAAAAAELKGKTSQVRESPVQASPVQTYLVQNEAHLAHAQALVKAALQAAHFEATFADAPMGNERRNVHQISSGKTHMDMMPATPLRLQLVREGKLRMIPVPLDRGILGYRINILLENKKDLLHNVRTAQDLSAFVMGQNEGWMDVEIYRAAGIPTKEVRNWSEGEFAEQMATGFIDLFPLGLEETLTFFLPHFRQRYPQLTVDGHILVRYPWFRFVWVTPGPEGDGLYAALVRGFDAIAKDGTFMKVWKQHRVEPEAQLFTTRHIIDIANPFYGDDLVPAHFQPLLFRPKS